MVGGLEGKHIQVEVDLVLHHREQFAHFTELELEIVAGGQDDL